MPVESKRITADELLKMNDSGRCELIQGDLVLMSPAGAANGVVVWITDPPKMTMAVHRVGVSAELLNLGNSLRDEPLLPGFVMPIDPIFKLLLSDMASHTLAPFPADLLSAKKQIREQARSYGLDFFPRHLRDVRLRADESDCRLWRVSSALSALAIWDGI